MVRLGEPSLTTAAPPLSDEDRDVLIRTVYGEARGEPEEGQIAVVHVIRNRALRRGTCAAAECRRPWQFSCWNADDLNCSTLRDLPPDRQGYRKIAAVVEKAWGMPDTTGGATHYYAPIGMHGRVPSWAVGATETARIGRHIFFKEVA
ncbi:hypothetical protein GCM10009416_37060 [Craurococcus roseus]|uniref:Cell wall hydrolase SleB domain-containing protein n=1 Tax=Craurococcus roseus TaxID=77585 RepID=A0ABN1FPV0_9PROT